MKIFLPCSSNPFFESSAVSNRYLTLIKGLSNLNVEVDILVINGTVVKQEKKLLKNITESTNIKIQYTHFFPGYNKFFNRLYLYIFKSIFSILNKYYLKKKFKKKYDFIFITGDIEVRRCFLNSNRLIKSKGVIELSEFQNLDSIQTNKVNSLFQFIINRKTKVNLKVIENTNIFLIMTKTLIPYYQSLSKNPKAKFLHLPMTVDLERFDNIGSNGNEFELPYILFVGVMNNFKDGVDILIKSFNLIKEKYPNYKLYLVGPWQYDTQGHLNLIKEYGLENRVFWMNEYSREKIPAIISNASLLVLPRPNSKQAQGGFPTKLGEYLASGKPVCATRVGEIPNYLVDNESVFFAEPGSVESFAEAMEKALSNPEIAEMVGMNGRKVAEKEFNKDIQAKKLYDFLKQIVAQKPLHH